MTDNFEARHRALRDEAEGTRKPGRWARLGDFQRSTGPLPVILSNVGGEMIVVRLRPGSKAQHVHAPAIAAILRAAEAARGEEG